MAKPRKVQNMTAEELDYIGHSLWSAMPLQTSSQSRECLTILAEAYEDAAEALRG